MNKQLIMIGAGGHSRVLIETLSGDGTSVFGCLDKEPTKLGMRILGVPVVGTDDELDSFTPQGYSLINGLGSVRDTSLRRAAFLRGKKLGFSFFSVIHQSAVLASDVSLGEGVQVMAGVIIQSGAKIGDNTIINTRAVIDHDCIIGNHVHLAPSVTLSGNVIVGDDVHIGVGATVIQGIKIGSGSLIAAGAVVVDDVPDGVRVMGVPAKEVGVC